MSESALIIGLINVTASADDESMLTKPINIIGVAEKPSIMNKIAFIRVTRSIF